MIFKNFVAKNEDEILEEIIIAAKEADVAIAKANELAKAWRKKNDS